MKRYVFELVVVEGNMEQWEELEASGKTGCDEILEDLKAILDFSNTGLDVTVTLKAYTNE